MPCNPCCCWKLKDAAVTIGIWSTIYALASLAMFTWQWGVLSQCRHVTMAQSNLQCEYYCPCVGASTARTSVIIEGLFVIQILCLISSFFLLFSSIMLIYGVHTWSRYLVWPWFICMASSILTSLAYCIMWWAGDVRDYWLVLTILEAFGVFLNCYCFVVICVFYKNMLIELEYYEGKRAAKYDRFSQRDTPQHTIEQDIEEDDDQQGASHMDYRYQPQQRGDGWEEWRGGAYPMTDTKYPPDPMPHHHPQQQQCPQQYAQQRSLYFPQKYDHSTVPRDPMLVPTNEPVDPLHERSRSALPPVQSVPSVFEDFRDVPRQEHRRSHRHRSSCRYCEPHKHRRRRSHSHHHKSYYSSDACSTEGGTESTRSRPHHHEHHRHRSHRHEGRRQHNSDNESDLISDTTADPNYQPRTSKRHKSLGDRKGPRQVKRETKERQQKSASMQGGGNEQEVPNSQEPAVNYQPAGCITIPQHIVIPPALDSSAERKYHINSEITISYDPRSQDRQAGMLMSPAAQPGSPASITQRRPATGMGQAPMSITSNV